MYTLIYRSNASPLTSTKDIKNIHKEALAFNREHGITGCLLHHKGKFVQLIEGSKDVILLLFEKIKKDPRHNNIQVLNTQKSSVRMFADWSMIFDDIDIDFSTKAPAKKRYFERIFHASNAVRTPGKSKFELWRQVNTILKGQESQSLKFGRRPLNPIQNIPFTS